MKNEIVLELLLCGERFYQTGIFCSVFFQTVKIKFNKILVLMFRDVCIYCEQIVEVTPCCKGHVLFECFHLP